MARTTPQVLTDLLDSAPAGFALSRDPGSVWASYLQPWANELSIAEAQAEAMLQEIDPRTCVWLLPDYERVLGADPYGRDAASNDLSAQQLAQLTWQRWTESGNANPADFVGLAASLGVPATVTQYRPTTCGVSECGTPLIVTPFEWLMTLEATVAATGAPTIVQSAGVRYAASSATIDLPAAPTVGNVLYFLCLTYGYGTPVPNPAGFATLLNGHQGVEAWVVSKRDVVAGDGASWAIAGALFNNPVTAVIVEVANVLSEQATAGVPTVTGDALSASLPGEPNALALFGFSTDDPQTFGAPAAGQTLLFASADGLYHPGAFYAARFSGAAFAASAAVSGTPYSPTYVGVAIAGRTLVEPLILGEAPAHTWPVFGLDVATFDFDWRVLTNSALASMMH